MINNTGGNLDLDGHNQTIGGITGSGTVYTSNGAATLSVGNGNISSTYIGFFNDDGNGNVLSVTKIGTGTLTLTNTSSFSGGITIAAGTLITTGDGSLGNGPLTFQGGDWNSSFNSSHALVTTATGGTWSPQGDFGFTGTIVGGGSLTINSGDLIPAPSLPTNIGTLTITGSGTRVLTGNGASNGANFITSTTNVFVTDGAKLDIGSGGSLNMTNPMTFSSGTSFSERNTAVAVTTVAGGGSVTFPSAGTMNFQNNDNGANQTMTINGNWTPLTGPLTISVGVNGGAGVVLNGGFTDGSGSNSVTFTGPNPFILNGTSTNGGGFYVGTTGNSPSTGILQPGAANVLSPNGVFGVNTGSTFDMAGYSQKVGSLTGGGTITTSSGSPVLTVGSDNTSPPAFSGILQGAVELSKVGTGTLILSNGSNSYTGGTSVTGGTLLVTNTTGSATSSGPVNVDLAGVLGGSGHISGLVTAGGGTVYPSGGGANAILNLTGLTMDNTATFEIKIASGILSPPTAGTNYDQVSSNGNVTLGNAQLVLNDASYIQTNNDTLDILHLTSGSISGLLDYNNVPLSNGALFLDSAGKLYRINYSPAGSPTDVILTSVPEPGTLVLGGLAAVGAVGLFRRIRHQRAAVPAPGGAGSTIDFVDDRFSQQFIHPADEISAGCFHAPSYDNGGLPAHGC